MARPPSTRRHAIPSRWALAGCGLLLAACSAQNPPPAPPPPEVAVIKTVATTVPLAEEFSAQTEAVDAVEVRARVGGILESQVYADGAAVKKGSRLFVIDRQPFIASLAQARAGLAQAQAAHVNSRQNLERIRPLLDDQAVSQQDVDTAIARERGDAANVEAAAAQVRQAELNLGYTTITAPRDGVVSKALVKPGGLVNAATTLLTTLYSVDPIYVNFVISEQRLLALRHYLDNQRRMPDFRLKLVDGSEYKYPGQLNFVDVAVDPKSGTLQLRLAVPNPERSLRSGQFVSVVLPETSAPTAMLVPQRAVQELQGKRSVFVVGPDNKATYREIKASKRYGNDWVVEGGLQPGELVVVDGIQKMKPGSVVKPVTALAANDSGAAPGTAKGG
ncbi:MAG: efflux RND transporter periplasmic adaptor subunit [Bacteroidota bacterium]